MYAIQPAWVAVDSQASRELICPTCKTAISPDQGLTILYGKTYFHAECFKCSKCNVQVTTEKYLPERLYDTPICESCSCICTSCGHFIADEAIMTSDDSYYHLECFNCKVCRHPINEASFAKTSRGIYCLRCHNARVARVRRYKQQESH
ncbi:hypothetical protein C8Q75DRAFT_404641 [Abortiporus biennis]|nr:hypothetical protein C8Q75DRAFT_404641 [Abortiporus biennis]